MKCNNKDFYKYDEDHKEESASMQITKWLYSSIHDSLEDIDYERLLNDYKKFLNEEIQEENNREKVRNK